jgi:hypothetical protein
VGTKLKERGGVRWPAPNPMRLKDDPRIPAGSENFGDAKLLEVCELIPGVSSIDLRVELPGKPDVMLAVDVPDIRRRAPLARFLKKHKGKTITELGELEVDF